MPSAPGDLVPAWLRWIRRGALLLLLALATLCALFGLQKLATYREVSAQAVLFHAARTCWAADAPLTGGAQDAACTDASAAITQLWKVRCGFIVLCYWVELAVGSQTVAIQVEDWPHWHILAVGQRIPVRLWRHRIVLARLGPALAPTTRSPDLEAQRAVRGAAPLAVTSVLCVFLGAILLTHGTMRTRR